MRWVRANLRLGSRLALLALAIQLVLSFGHVHLDGMGLVSQHNAAVAAAADPGGGPDGSPANHDPLCPICLSIQLAGALLQPSPPAVVVPAPAAWTPPPLALAFATPADPHSFNARAPPLA
jgi:hypothetical protein